MEDERVTVQDKINAELLTLPGLGFYESLRTAGSSRPAVKKHAVSQKILSILHEILYIYCFDNME